MRFVAKYRRYNINFQREIVEHFATGQSHEIQPFLTCQFDLYGSMKPHEVEAARREFINHGLPVDVDGVTTIDPLYRFSVFDTELCQRQFGFDDAKREEMEQFLVSRPEFGTDYILVEDPKLAPPWPTYDDFRGVRGLPTPQAIAKKVSEDGYAVADVVAYEQQNANRTDVIEALDGLSASSAVGVGEEELIEA